MKLNLIIILLVLYTICSGAIFMLIKTWIMNQFIWIRKGKYIIRKKDKFWNRAGWISATIFMIWCVLTIVLLKGDFKISL